MGMDNNIAVNSLNLIGKVFGEWTVLSQAESRRGSSYWLCECSCGNTQDVRGTALIQGKSSKCVKCARAENGRKNRKDDFHVACGTIISQYKRNAKSRGIPFELTKDDVKELVIQDCYYCGNQPSNTVKTFSGRTSTHREVFYNGIDRIDSSKGYTIDNVVPCCFRCNWAKSDLTEEQFKNWIKRLYLNLFRRHSDKTPGELIDQLFTTDYKCWWAQEKIMDETLSDKERKDAAKKAQEYNAKRNKLIRKIDFLLDFYEDTPTEKTYSDGDGKEEYTYFENEK